MYKYANLLIITTVNVNKEANWYTIYLILGKMIVTQENISMEESFHKIKICILCIGTCICVLCSKLKKPNQSISF